MSQIDGADFSPLLAKPIRDRLYECREGYNTLKCIPKCLKDAFCLERERKMVEIWPECFTGKGGAAA